MWKTPRPLEAIMDSKEIELVQAVLASQLSL
jgi:hypothetical protein